MTSKEELELLTNCLEEHKAEDIVAIDVTASSPFASYVLLATCPNPRALGATQGHVEDALYKAGLEVSVKEGEPDSGWMIIQGEEVICHLMLQGNRRMIDLEGLLEQLNRKHAPKKAAAEE